jgi:CheY-like chemotaxis protein
MARGTHFAKIPLDQVPTYETLQSPTGHTPSILVVDDERIIADTLSTIFNQSGYAAIAAYDGASALDLATALPPDLLISDVAMPGMSGIELAILMKTACPNCHVILFSGQASTLDLLAAARSAGHDFQALSKPLHPAVMLSTVSGVLQERAAAF